MAKRRKVEPGLRQWEVEYEVVRHGTTTVEAASAEEARAIVESGDFEEDSCDERVDWKAIGDATEA